MLILCWPSTTGHGAHPEGDILNIKCPKCQTAKLSDVCVVYCDNTVWIEHMKSSFGHAVGKGKHFADNQQLDTGGIHFKKFISVWKSEG